MLGDRTSAVTAAGHKSIHGGGESVVRACSLPGLQESVGERAVGDKRADEVRGDCATRREVHSTVEADRFLAVPPCLSATSCR